MSRNDGERNRHRWLLMIVGATAVGLIGCGVVWLWRPGAFFVAWLAAILLPWGLTLGSAGLMLIGCLTGGRWARAAWPWLATQARLIPFVALLFIPFLAGIDRIYPWADGSYLAQFEHTEHRQWYFQPSFFILRSVVYWGIWVLISWLLTGPFWRPPRREPCQVTGGQGIAGLGLVVLVLSGTWAVMDWVMSFDPFFVSTLFGMLVGGGALLSALGAAVAAVCLSPQVRNHSWTGISPTASPSMRDTERTIGDLANLLLALLMLWAYFSFAQYLIMWSGDLPAEAAFYRERITGLWGWVVPAVIVVGFVTPFLCLLSHDFKRSPRKLAMLALVLIVVRQIELWWLVCPSVSPPVNQGLTWAAIPAVLGAAGGYALVLAWFTSRPWNQPLTEVVHV